MDIFKKTQLYINVQKYLTMQERNWGGWRDFNNNNNNNNNNSNATLFP